MNIFSRIPITVCCLVAGLGLDFSVWLVSKYSHAFILLSIAIVPYPST